VREVVVDAHVTPRDLFRVSLELLLRNPVSLTLIVAGPVLWAFGSVSGSAVVTRLGSTMSWLVLLVPAFALLIASYAAYRPGASDLYAQARWTFREDSVDVDQPSRSARAEWSEFTGWRTAAGSYLLHTSPKRYVVLPMRDVAEGDRADLESLFAAALGLRRR
jgi:hypothetical protein